MEVCRKYCHCHCHWVNEGRFPCALCGYWLLRPASASLRPPLGQQVFLGPRVGTDNLAIHLAFSGLSLWPLCFPPGSKFKVFYLADFLLNRNLVRLLWSPFSTRPGPRPAFTKTPPEPVHPSALGMSSSWCSVHSPLSACGCKSPRVPAVFRDEISLVPLLPFLVSVAITLNKVFFTVLTSQNNLPLACLPKDSGVQCGLEAKGSLIFSSPFTTPPVHSSIWLQSFLSPFQVSGQKRYFLWIWDFSW